MKSFLLAITIGLLAISSAGADTTITFDPLPGGQRIAIGGYTEGGMIFGDNSTVQTTIVADSGGIPSNGTAFLASCGICRPSLQPEGGGLFDLVGVDLGDGSTASDAATWEVLGNSEP